MRVLRTLTLASLTSAALAVAAPSMAGGGGSVCPAYQGSDSTLIILQDNCFGPVSATANAGSVITVRNDGSQAHTYTAIDGSFDTGQLQPGESATIELPDSTGVLPVYCTLHASGSDGFGMAGTIALGLSGVEASAGTVSAAGLGSNGLALVGGFLLGAATLAALGRRGRAHHAPHPIAA